MELPKRSKQHISESKSYRIFRNNIPDHWVVREVTERDYGIDCYIELVNSQNRLQGDLISIQVKSEKAIEWNKDNNYCLSRVSISNTNYWYLFSVPVFICLVDLFEESVYYLAVKKYIRENFDAYLNKQTFSYVFKKEQKMDTQVNNLKAFLYQYYFDKDYELIVKDVINFISNFKSHLEFIHNNIGRDFFLGVEWSRVVFINHIYNLLNSLCSYFDFEWDLEKFDIYRIKSQNKYGNHYELYEKHLSEMAEKMEVKMKPLLLKIRTHICETESTYWLSRDNKLSNYLYNITDNCEFPD